MQRDIVRHAAFALLALCLLGGCGGDPPPDQPREGGDRPRAGWTTYHHERLGFEATFPSGWHRARQSLTNLIDPREILSLATYPLRGAAPNRCLAPIDAPTPALDGLGPADAIISIQERGRGRYPGFPARQKPFRLPPLDLRYPRGAPDCVTGRVRFVAFHPFRVGGRNFYAFVAVGRSASKRTRRDVRAILENFRPDPEVRPTWRASG